MKDEAAEDATAEETIFRGNEIEREKFHRWFEDKLAAEDRDAFVDAAMTETAMLAAAQAVLAEAAAKESLARMAAERDANDHHRAGYDAREARVQRDADDNARMGRAREARERAEGAIMDALVASYAAAFERGAGRRA